MDKRWSAQISSNTKRTLNIETSASVDSARICGRHFITGRPCCLLCLFHFEIGFASSRLTRNNLHWLFIVVSKGGATVWTGVDMSNPLSLGQYSFLSKNDTKHLQYTFGQSILPLFHPTFSGLAPPLAVRYVKLVDSFARLQLVPQSELSNENIA